MTKETSEGNKTLAVFMGAYIKETEKWFTAYQWKDNKQYCSSTPITMYGTKEQTLEHIYKWLLDPEAGSWGRFHNDWNWLQPVWFKFRDIDYQKFKSASNRMMFLGYCQHIKEAITNPASGTPSEAFNLLVEAITWYNTIKEK